MTHLENLFSLKKAQIKPSAEMFARALQDDPFITYLIPNSTERKNKSHILFEGMVRYGVLYGEVHATSHNLEGVAVWVPSEKVDFGDVEIDSEWVSLPPVWTWKEGYFKNVVF